MVTCEKGGSRFIRMRLIFEGIKNPTTHDANIFLEAGVGRAKFSNCGNRINLH